MLINFEHCKRIGLSVYPFFVFIRKGKKLVL